MDGGNRKLAWQRVSTVARTSIPGAENIRPIAAVSAPPSGARGSSVSTEPEVNSEDVDTRKRYKTPDGKALPSVTTIIKSSLGGWGLQGLMNWAAKQAREGLDHNKTRDEAGTIGTIVHLMIENFINEAEDDPGMESYSDEDIAKAQVPFESFLAWYTQNDIQFLSTEQQMTSLIHGFGGTCDAVAKINGKPTIIDYKSSKDIYPTVLAQLGGYSILLEETQKQIIMDGVVIHIGKEGQFGIYVFKHEDLYQGRTLFHHACSVYKMKSAIEKRVNDQKKAIEARNAKAATP